MFADPKHGIFVAIPGTTMHAYCMRSIDDITNFVLDKVSASSKALLESWQFNFTQHTAKIFK